jgi:bacterioferritin-associated ferredoxin
MILKFGTSERMIVCLCANVTDRQLAIVVANGASTVREVGRECGAGAGCGACKPLIRECLAAHRLQQEERTTEDLQTPVEIAAEPASTLAPA